MANALNLHVYGFQIRLQVDKTQLQQQGANHGEVLILYASASAPILSGGKRIDAFDKFPCVGSSGWGIFDKLTRNQWNLGLGQEALIRGGADLPGGYYLAVIRYGDRYWQSGSSAFLPARAKAYSNITVQGEKAKVANFKINDLQYPTSFYSHFYVTNKEIVIGDGLPAAVFEQRCGRENFIKLQIGGGGELKKAAGLYYAYAKLAGKCNNDKVYPATPNNTITNGDAPPGGNAPDEPLTFSLEIDYEPKHSDLQGIAISPNNVSGLEAGSEQSVSISGIPNGWMFSHWSQDMIGTNPNPTFIMTSDKRATAHFIRKHFPLSIVVSPIGAGVTNPLPLDCIHYKEFGENVQVQATPRQGWKFVKWMDKKEDILSTDASYNFIMDGAKAIGAYFEPIFYEIEFKAEGTGSGDFEVIDLVADSKETIKYSDLKVGIKKRFPIWSHLLIVAKPHDSSEFLLWSEGATLLSLAEGPPKPTTEYDRTQAVVGLAADAKMVGQFIIQKETRPLPRYSYVVECPKEG